MDHREPASFKGLPIELLLLVLEHCDTQGLVALSGVAKNYNNICRSIVFREVDLSIHNRGKVLCTFPATYQCPPDRWFEPSDSLQCNNVPTNMQKRQEAFLLALIADPSLAQHVKTFSWTLLLLDSNRRISLENPFKINESVLLGPKSPFKKIWNVFASLTSVRTLDLAWLSRHLAMPLIHSIPPILFPAATSVRLVGVMPYSLAASILLANPQNLLHLDIDNLQQSGIIPSTHIEDLLDDTAAGKTHGIKRRPAKPILIPPHLQTRQSWNNVRPFRTNSKYFNAPGPMQNLLGALAGKCTSLKTLRLRKAGARDQFDFTPACRSKEVDFYAEWAIFLASVKPTLESLIFEQGERLLHRAEWAQPAVRPMDQLFGDTIFPVLTTAGIGEWPKMKRLLVRGLQQWKEGGGQGVGETVLVDGRGGLKGAFGKGVEVVIERKARVADHLGVGYG